MIGKDNGLVAKIKKLAPGMQSIHCIIHQSILCAKLSGELKEVMEAVMKIINYIRSKSSLQHRLFQKLLVNMDSQHQDLLLYNDICWLSKGEASKRFINLREEVTVFLGQCTLKKSAKFRKLVEDDTFMCNTAFLCDIFSHLNVLNTQLQGRDRSILDMFDRISAFQGKIELFSTDIESHKLLHFPTLKAMYVSPENITPAMITFVKRLKENFSSRFDDFNVGKEVIRFILNPFSSVFSNLSSNFMKMFPDIEEAQIQLELIDLKQSSVLKDKFDDSGVTQFWIDLQQGEYPLLKRCSIDVLTMFGSTYICESAFSKQFLSKFDTRAPSKFFTYFALTSYEPDFIEICKKMKCHFSH